MCPTTDRKDVPNGPWVVKFAHPWWISNHQQLLIPINNSVQGTLTKRINQKLHTDMPLQYLQSYARPLEQQLILLSQYKQKCNYAH